MIGARGVRARDLTFLATSSYSGGPSGPPDRNPQPALDHLDDESCGDVELVPAVDDENLLAKVLRHRARSVRGIAGCARACALDMHVKDALSGARQVQGTCRGAGSADAVILGVCSVRHRRARVVGSGDRAVVQGGVRRTLQRLRPLPVGITVSSLSLWRLPVDPVDEKRFLHFLQRVIR